jgi:hypothetical protein
MAQNKPKTSFLTLVDDFGKEHKIPNTGYAEEGSELGAVRKMSNALLMNQALTKSLANMNKKARGRLAPLVVPIQSALKNSARSIASALRARRGFVAALRPNWISPLNFDGIGATSVSGIATQAAPHQSWWLFMGIACSIGDPASTVPELRLISLKVRGLERLMDASAQLTWSAGAPTNPGVPFSAFDQRRNQGADVLAAQHAWHPWGTNPGGTWLEESVTINCQAYNPHSAAQSRTLLLYGRSSPCNQGDEDRRVLSMSQARRLIKLDSKKGVQEFKKLAQMFQTVGGMDIYEAAGLGAMEFGESYDE